MTIKAYIVDTGYLLALFKVPNTYTDISHKEIKERFSNAIDNNSRLYVPFPCICELGNRIAQANNGRVRRELARKLRNTVKSSLEEGIPWIITPFKGIDNLDRFINIAFRDFTNIFVDQGIGLTDTVVIEEAKRLKNKYSGSGLQYKVHIWTTDVKVKALEPETEQNSFLGT